MDALTDPLVHEPPPLPYTLRTRKLSIAGFWIVFFIDTFVQPVVLYFTLWYLTDLSANLVFTISTATLGGVSVMEYFYRFYMLFRKGSKVRPLNARRSWLDFFHINFTLVWVILAVELIVGTVQDYPPIRLLAMPLPTVLFYFGGVHLTLDFLRARGFQAPFRISSTPQGSVMPTALYVLIEDIVAVDGGGGQKYRRALRDRYLASPYFRQMLFEMNCFWGGGSIIAAAIATALVFTLERDAAYVVGWGVPYVWAALWTIITIPWVQADLRREKAAFSLTRQNSILGPTPYADNRQKPKPLTHWGSASGRLMSHIPFHKPGTTPEQLKRAAEADRLSRSRAVSMRSNSRRSRGWSFRQSKSPEEGPSDVSGPNHHSLAEDPPRENTVEEEQQQHPADEDPSRNNEKDLEKGDG